MPGLRPNAPARRLTIAIFTCAIAAVLFHGEVAMALVSRGDDYLTRGELTSALRYYDRAIKMDARSEAAVDRYVFFSTSFRDSTHLRRAIEVASRFLANNPMDAHVLADRALCYEHLKDYQQAARDFTLAARAGRSARAYTFAGWAMLRSGKTGAARDLWLDALTIEPDYGPARHALHKVVRP